MSYVFWLWTLCLITAIDCMPFFIVSVLCSLVPSPWFVQYLLSYKFTPVCYPTQFPKSPLNPLYLNYMYNIQLWQNPVQCFWETPLIISGAGLCSRGWVGSVYLHNEGGLTRHIQDHREQADCWACQELSGDEVLQGAVQAGGGGREGTPTTTTAMVCKIKLFLHC